MQKGIFEGSKKNIENLSHVKAIGRLDVYYDLNLNITCICLV